MDEAEFEPTRRCGHMAEVVRSARSERWEICCLNIIDRESLYSKKFYKKETEFKTILDMFKWHRCLKGLTLCFATIEMQTLIKILKLNNKNSCLVKQILSKVGPFVTRRTMLYWFNSGSGVMIYLKIKKKTFYVGHKRSQIVMCPPGSEEVWSVISLTVRPWVVCKAASFLLPRNSEVRIIWNNIIKKSI